MADNNRSSTSKYVEEKIPEATVILTPSQTIGNPAQEYSFWQLEMKYLLPAKLCYLFFGLSQAQMSKFLGIFLEDVGFEKIQVGSILSVIGITSLIGPPAWGVLSDITNRQRLIHNFCIITAASLMFSIQFIRNFYVMWIIAFLGYLQTAPSFSLLDQAVLAAIDSIGAGQYGRQRLAKSVGSCIAAITTGILVSGLGLKMIFYAHVIFAAVALFFLQMMPAPEDCLKKKKENDLEKNKGGKVDLPFRQSLMILIKKVDLMLLFIVSIAYGALQGAQCTFLYPHIRSFNAEGKVNIVGYAVAGETIAEVPFFFFAQAIIKKLGVHAVLLLSAICTGIRFYLYSSMTVEESAIYIAFFHGITYALTWTCICEYVYSSSPIGTHGTSMGLLNVFYNGLGRFLGSIVGGALLANIEQSNPTWSNSQVYSRLWLVLVLVVVPIAIVSVFILFIVSKCSKKKEEEVPAAPRASAVVELQMPRYDSDCVPGTPNAPYCPVTPTNKQ